MALIIVMRLNVCYRRDAWAVSLFAYLICLIYLYAFTLCAVNVVVKRVCVVKFALFKLLTCAAFDAIKNKQKLGFVQKLKFQLSLLGEMHFKCVS